MRVAAALYVGQACRSERYADRGVAKPFRRGRPYIDDRVMHVLTARWAEFRHLHPTVPAKVRWQNLVRVIDVTFGSKSYRPWHFDHNIRRRNAPAFRPMKRRRRFVRVTGAGAAVGPYRQRLDFILRKRRIVQEAAAVRIG